MARDRVEFLRLDNVALTPSVAPGLGHGMRAAVLSAAPDRDGARSLLVRAEPYWCSHDSGFLSNDLEVLVLDGDLRLGGMALKRGSYGFFPKGLSVPGAESGKGFTALWMSDGVCELSSDPALAKAFLEERRTGPVDVNSIAWQPTPDFPGRSREEAGAGLHVRMLHSDPATGAYTLMTFQEPGWSDPRMEAHETWEELVLLQGDYLMGETGMITSGSYIFRPGEKPHGPQATLSGAVWFCRGEKEIDFQFTLPHWTEARCEEYLGSPVPDPQPRLWGVWN